jgi:multimeric flavodoxin WrbA
MMSKLTVINSSPNETGTTAKALEKYSSFLMKKYSIEEIESFNISECLIGCQDCRPCEKYCKLEDEEFEHIIFSIEDSEYVLFGSPVYLDMPTGSMVNFLTRLNCMAESTNREWFKNKKAFFLATALCSGTKSVIHTMMGACEMLGFIIEGRSSREYIKLWKDDKIRGGYKGEEIYLEVDKKGV